jgi:hypothetical protein
MDKLKKSLMYDVRIFAAFLMLTIALLILSTLSVTLVHSLGLLDFFAFLTRGVLFWPIILVVLGVWSGYFVVFCAWQIAAWFLESFYNLSNRAEAHHFLLNRFFGSPDFHPYLLVKDGMVVSGDEILKKIGGPGSLLLYDDSAVILERGGRLSRVIKGSFFDVKGLKPFEKIWDVLDLDPHTWEFPVNAVTQDGIPVTYHVQVQFRVKANEEAIFKAATSKWIRDANRSEPERLMAWDKRVMFSYVEGGFRSILANYNLDELLEVGSRRKIRRKLWRKVKTSAESIGVEIMRVYLGDIKLDRGINQQRIEAWRAEMQQLRAEEIMAGEAFAAREIAEAEAEVRQTVLKRTLELLKRVEKNRKLTLQIIVLNLIEAMREMALGSKISIPHSIEQTIVGIEDRLQSGTGSPKSS